METILHFLSELRRNNHKEWFDAHRKQYQVAVGKFHTLTEKLIEAIADFDPTIAGLTVKDCTYRIYRDIRFSNDKSPYKTHMGAYICRGGKKSGYAGYYFHIEPGDDCQMSNHMLFAGLHCAEPKIVKSVREEIDDHGEQLVAAIKKAKGFSLGQEYKLKRVPAGFPSDHPYAEYLKLKDIYLEKSVDDDYLLAENLIERVARDFRSTKPLLDQLNRAVEYAYEEM